MSELSPKASALLQAARKAPRAPSSEAVERMERAVLVATGVTAAAAGAGAAKSASAWALSATGKGVLSAVALTIAGATVTASLIARKSERVAAPELTSDPLTPTLTQREREQPTPTSDPLTPTLTQREREQPTPTSDPLTLTLSRGKREQPQAKPPPQLTPPPAPPLVGVGSEIALLQSAKAKLDSGDWAAAQTLLDQHHAEFPGGALSLEADVLRVLAWCGDGHLAEASELAARVRERAPRAPATARLAGSCVDQ